MPSIIASTQTVLRAAALAGVAALTLAGASLGTTEPAQAYDHGYGDQPHFGFAHRGFAFRPYGYGFRPYGVGYGYRPLGFVRPVVFGRPCVHRVFTPYGIRFRRFC